MGKKSMTIALQKEEEITVSEATKAVEDILKETTQKALLLWKLFKEGHRGKKGFKYQDIEAFVDKHSQPLELPHLISTFMWELAKKECESKQVTKKLGV